MFNKLLFIFLLWSIIITEVSANDIYINQVGDGIDVDIVQDGSNNRVSRKEDTVTSTPNKARTLFMIPISRLRTVKSYPIPQCDDTVQLRVNLMFS